MYTKVEKIWDAATLVIGNNFTPIFYVRGCEKVMLAYRCTTTQTGVPTPNWRSGEEADQNNMPEGGTQNDVTTINGAPGTPGSGLDWQYTGVRPAGDGIFAQRFMQCRVSVATADITNLTCYLIRVFRDRPSGIPDNVAAS